METLLRSVFPNCDFWGTSLTAEAVELAPKINPDLILLDLHLPKPPSAPETCRRLRDRSVIAPILIVTAYERDVHIASALAAGAVGCVVKDSTTAYLASALRRALNGKSVVDPRVQRWLGAAAVDARPPTGGALTDRERQVIVRLAEGQSNREIGRELGLAESTVKWHVRQLMTKLDSQSRWQAVVRAREWGLV
jgi:two-component system nitrate/nitrite response regulator NarL